MVKAPTIDLDSLPSDWAAPGDWVTAGELESELVRETIPGHALHTQRVIAVAVKRQLKDVIFWLPDSKAWAWVHLTWHEVDDPSWPASVIQSDWKALIREVFE